MFYTLTLPAWLENLAIDDKDLPPGFADTAPAWAEQVFPRAGIRAAHNSYVYAHPAIDTLPAHFTDHAARQEAPPSWLDKLHAPSFDIFQKKIFPVNMQWIKQHPPPKASRLAFSHTFKLKTAGGHYANYLQTNHFLVSPTGIPLATAGSVYDISSYKNDNSIVHLIEDREAAEPERVVMEKHYHPEAKRGVLSPRELEILVWIAEGLSSKQIAAKTGISINTVNNHRNKMLQRTNCRNSYELIIYGMKNNLL